MTEEGTPTPSNPFFGVYPKNLYLFDRKAGLNRLVAVTGFGDNFFEVNNKAATPSLSADGRYLALKSIDPVPISPSGAAFTGILVFDRETGVSSPVDRSSHDDSASQKWLATDPIISADGSSISFGSDASDLLPGDTLTGFNIFLFDRGKRTHRLVSRRAVSIPSATGGGTPWALGGNGRFVVFSSESPFLVAGQRNMVATNLFLHDQASKQTVLITHRWDSQTICATRHYKTSIDPVMSDDGRFVAYSGPFLDLVEGLPFSESDIFLYDRETGSNELVSRSLVPERVGANGGSLSPAISADGRFIAFISEATDLVNGQTDSGRHLALFLHDRLEKRTVLASHEYGSETVPAAGDCFAPVLSADGRYLAYTSPAPNLIAGQSGSKDSQVYLYDRTTGENILVSHTPGRRIEASSGYATYPVMSADGRYVLFSSNAPNLAEGQIDTNQKDDLFLLIGSSMKMR